MSKTIKRATLVLALTPVLAVPAVSAYAGTTAVTAPSVTTAAASATTAATSATKPVVQTVVKSAPRDSGSSGTGTVSSTSTSAPSSSASATAAKVSGIIAIADTSATAGSSNTAAHSDSLDLLGSRVVGGDAKAGGGPAGGNLIATGDTPLGDVEVLPWSALATQSGTASSAKAEAALAHAGLLGVLQLWLLHSQSQANWNNDASTGSASTDGGEVNLDNQLDVKVLHADATSDGKSSSALLVINGQPILSSSDANGSCSINVDPLLSLLCLQASGGNGSAAASVVQLASQAAGLTGVVTGASSSGGHVATPTTSVSGSRAPKSQQGPLPHTNGPSSATNGKLPFTGSEAELLALYGALLTGLGASITVASRRRSGAAPA